MRSFFEKILIPSILVILFVFRFCFLFYLVLFPLILLLRGPLLLCACYQCKSCPRHVVVTSPDGEIIKPNAFVLLACYQNLIFVYEIMPLGWLVLLKIAHLLLSQS